MVESNASPHALHILRSRGWIANTSMIRNLDYLKELGLSEGDVVGFKPDSEYEFNIDGQKLYRILSNYITTNYVEETKSN